MADRRNINSQSKDLYIGIAMPVFLFVIGAILKICIGNESEYITNWYSRRDLNLLYPQLKIGDRLEFKRRGGYNHWAIYVASNTDESPVIHHNIIHRSIPPNATQHWMMDILNRCQSCSNTFGSIREDTLESQLNDDEVRINNYQDKFWTPFTGSEVVVRAKKMMSNSESEVKAFNVLTNNCEHFVNECRYNVHYSHQVSRKIIDGIFELKNIF